MEYRSPQTEEEFEGYYRLRWEVLRKPWGHARGTERGDDEASSFHLIAIEGDEILGVGRLHEREEGVMQIRYMAVAPEGQGRGVGSGMMAALEMEARRQGARRILLDSRESAVSFYEKNGYGIVAESYLLWGEIQHFVMTKEICGS